MRYVVSLFACALVACAASPRTTLASTKQARARECERTDDCMVAAASCCGNCPAHAQSIRGTSAVRCPVCGLDCLDVEDPRHVAYCTTAGRCAMFDLAHGPLARCTTDTDCIVRAAGCCEYAPRAWVAIAASQRGAYERRVCAANATCEEGIPAVPTDTAVCVAAHCVLARTQR
jgi:hypothetical protein